MADLKKFFISRPLLCLSVIFFITRLINLTLLPIFIDESTFIDWGWRTVNVPGMFFFPLAFYKMPLVMWFFGIAQFFFADPLFAGRLVGILMGWLTLWGIFKLTKTLTDFKTAVIACLLYLVIPIFVYFDRQALMESALMAANIWSCYFLCRYLKKPCWSRSILLGTALGLGVLVKANGIIFIPAAFLIIFYFAVKDRSRRYPLLTFSLVSLLTFLLVMSPVLSQQIFWTTIHNVSDFTLTVGELLRFPVLLWLKNIWTHLEIIFWYFTPLIFVALILSRKNISIIGVWSLLTLVITSLMVKHAQPRYLAPYLPPLLILAADWFSRKKLILLPIFITPALLLSTILLFNPPAFYRTLSRVTSETDIIGYLTGENTGYQAMATINYLKTHLPGGYVFVAVAPNAGNPEQAVFNYLRRRPDTFLGYMEEHLFNVDLSQISCLTASVPVFFVARNIQQVGLHNFFTLWATVTNSYNSDYNNIYTLKTDCPGKIISIDGLINYYRDVLR